LVATIYAYLAHLARRAAPLPGASADNRHHQLTIPCARIACIARAGLPGNVEQCHVEAGVEQALVPAAREV